MPTHHSPSRRSMVRSAAWGVPVIAVGVSAPRLAASPVAAPIPVSQLRVESYPLVNLNAGGQGGPLQWVGGHIGYQGQWNGPAQGTVRYTVVLTGPGGLAVILAQSSATITLYGQFTVPSQGYGAAPMTPGTYTVTLTVEGADGSVERTSTVTI